MNLRPLRLPPFPRWLSSPAKQIALLGTLSWLAYLDLASDYSIVRIIAKPPVWDFGRAHNWSAEALAYFLLHVMGPLIPYLVGWRIVRRYPANRRLLLLILALAALFAITLLAMYPIGATDIFDYIFHTRILVHYGQNPLAVPPQAFRDDPLYSRVVWYDQASPYGPVWTLLTVPVGYLAGDDLIRNVFLMKSLVILFFLGSAVLVALILQRLDPGRQLAGTLLFAWNPLLLFEAPGNGHNGIVMVFFTLLAVFLYSRQRWTWVLPALLASALVKYVTLLLLPPFLIFGLRAQAGRRQRLLWLARTTIASAVVLGASLLPFQGRPTGLEYEVQWFSLLAVPTLLVHSLKGALGRERAEDLALLTGSGAFLLVYVLSLWFMARTQHLRRLMVLNTAIILAYLGLASTGFQPWFVVWPASLGIWLNHPLVVGVLLTFTASSLLTYAAGFVWIWNWQQWGPLQANAMFVAVIFLPPLAVGLISLVKTHSAVSLLLRR